MIHWTTKLLLDKAEFGGVNHQYGMDWILNDSQLTNIKGALEIRLTMPVDGSKLIAVCLDLGEPLGKSLVFPIDVKLSDLLLEIEKLAGSVEVKPDES